MSQTKAQLLDNIKDNVQLDARNALRFADTDSSHYVAFKAPATVSSNVTWTLPAADGSANYVLATDGSGTLSWIADPAGQWVTSGSNIYFTGGNVGIGDSSPSNPLSVTGASAFNGDVQFTGDAANVTWDKSDDDLKFGDSAKAVFGLGSDLAIWSGGAATYIQTQHTGGTIYLGTTSADNLMNITSSGVTFLGETFWTNGNDIKLNDSSKILVGTGSDIQIYHDASDSFITNATGNLYIRGNGSNNIRLQAKSAEDGVLIKPDGAVELYYDGGLQTKTTSTGLHLADDKRIDFGTSSDLRIYHDGSNSYIADEGTGDIIISSGTITFKNQARNETHASFIGNGSCELYYDNTKKFETTSDGVQVLGRFVTSGEYNYLQSNSTSTATVTLKKSASGANSIDYLQCRDSNNTLYHTIQGGGHIKLQDNVILKIGDSDDLQIKHDSANSYFTNNTGELVFNGDTIRLRKQDGLEDYIKCEANAAVKIYYNGSKKWETVSDGQKTHGHYYADDGNKIQLGTSQDLQFWHDGTNSIIKNGTGDLFIRSDNNIQFQDAGGNETFAKFIDNGGVELYYDNDKICYTSNTCLAFPDSRKLFFGAGNDLQIFHDGTHNYIQNAVAGQDLYLSTKRDLHLQMGDNDGGYHDCFYADNNGSVRLYHDANERFKTLSDGVVVNGGIYLDGSGGTAAANKLDDYEEGTWTPDPHDGTCSATNPTYRKVGSLVECWAFLSSFSDTSTNDQIKITGLPFTPAHAHVAGTSMCSYSNDVSCVHAYVSTMGHVHFYGNNSGGYSQYRHNEINNASAQIYLHVAYYVS